MIYESDITALVSQWEANQETLNVRDCISSMRDLIDRTHDEEAQRFADPTDFMTPEETKEYFEDMEADYWIEQQKNTDIYYS